MEKQDLILLKEKLNKLNDSEKKLRMEYLKKIGNGEILGPMTGYPSIDLPSLKFYRDNAQKEINPYQTIYEMVFNQEDMNKEAIGYLGKTWTYNKFKLEVDKCAGALKQIGLQENDVVLIGVSNSPESLVILLALNKIGAVSKWFDLRASEKDIANYANSSNCKYMVSFSLIIPKVLKAIDNTNLQKVIVMDPANPILNLFTKVLYNIKSKKDGSYIEIPKDPRFVKYDKFIKGGNIDNSKPVKFDKDKSAIMIQSSGTTGKPKTITHSNLSATEGVIGLSYTDLPIEDGKKLLVALPPWIAYGLGNAIIFALTMGTKVELCPDFEPDAVLRNIGKFTISFAAPFHYRYIRDHYDELSENQKEILRNCDCLVSGGDKITVEENKEFDELFGTSVINGYGNNEGWGALSVNPVKHNKYGTVGIPKYGEVVTAYDTENDMELTYGQNGEICSLANTTFIGYENNEEATNEVKKTHNIDSKVWLHTGDLGFIDEEGFIHLGGRARRVIIRLGFKISAYTIEDKASENQYVKECVAVSVKDNKEEHVPMLYVVPKDLTINKNEIEVSIRETCKELKEYEIPKYINIVETLPYTPNNKYDFVLLEQWGNEYVDKIQNEDISRVRKIN